MFVVYYYIVESFITTLELGFLGRTYEPVENSRHEKCEGPSAFRVRLTIERRIMRLSIITLRLFLRQPFNTHLEIVMRCGIHAIFYLLYIMATFKCTTSYERNSLKFQAIIRAISHASLFANSTFAIFLRSFALH